MTQTPLVNPLLQCDLKASQTWERAKLRKLNLHVLASCSIMFAGGFRATQLFPYASVMTEELRGNTAGVGFWTGVLLATQSLGMLPTATLWAHFSNAYGRRLYLLIGLTSNIITLCLITFCNNYWMVLSLRLLSGLMDSTLPIMRTSLREAFQCAGQDDTKAFSLVQVAFAASSVTGPALGGILYGQEFGFGTWQWPPWFLPYLLCIVFYVIALILTYYWLAETADTYETESSTTTSPQSVHGEPRQKIELMHHTPFLLLLVMCGGHSYVFTGWELAFPFIAHLPLAEGGEALLPADIGTVFLVGSVGLIMYNLLLYPKLAQQFSIIDIWRWSLTLPVLVIMIFPRLVNALSSEGVPFRPIVMQFVNYASQFLISVLLGSSFTSIQLIANSYIASLPNSSRNLALANGWLSSIQALVRSVSPSLTGALFAARKSNLPFLRSEGNALSFDSLAVVLVFCCLLTAAKFPYHNKTIS